MARDYEDPFKIQGLRPAGSSGIAGPATRVRRQPVYAGTPQQQRNIDRFNRRFGASSPAAQQSLNTLRDATGMSNVIAARNRTIAENQLPGAVGYANPNSIVSNKQTTNYDSQTGVATTTGAGGTQTSYVAPGTSAPRGVSSGFAGPLGSARAAGAEDYRPRLTDNTVSNTNERDPLEVSTAGVPLYNQPESPPAPAVDVPAELDRGPLVTSSDSTPLPPPASEQQQTAGQQQQTAGQPTEGLGKRPASEYRRYANSIANRLIGRSPETRAMIMQEMANDPDLAPLLSDDIFTSILQQYL